MPFISSPVAYPPSSSPTGDAESRKRRNPESRPAPAKRRLLHNNVGLPSKDAPGNEGSALNKDFIAPPLPSPDDSVVEPSPFAEDDADEGGASDHSNEELPAAHPSAEALHRPSVAGDLSDGSERLSIIVEASSGRKHVLRRKPVAPFAPYERLVAQRSTTAPGKATRSYYGIDMHQLLEDVAKLPARSIESEPPAERALAQPVPQPAQPRSKRGSMLWTEKYRARRFTDLVGDERTHRGVLGWVKGWDPIVFPGNNPRPTATRKQRDGEPPQEEQRRHRKILLLTGPPGLGKTTLAHVCARQAGYEVVEINASDERSRDVVRGKIRDCLGTENVRGVQAQVGDRTERRPGRPVCVVVDEVDGVVGGSGQAGGEGGFMKAIVDLVQLDQRNANAQPSADGTQREGKKGDRFRILRPLILICNDLYHPALRPLRTSNLAEIVHMRRPPLDKVVGRVRTVLEKEGLQTDADGVRRLCEATWGVTSGQKAGRGASNTCEGDLRGVLVVAEGMASRLRANATVCGEPPRVTKQWVEKHLVSNLSCGGGGDRGTGRGSVKDAVERVFLEGAGFPKNISQPTAPAEHWTENAPKSASSVSDAGRGHAIGLLRDLLRTCAEPDRIATDIFTKFPARPFQDDTLLSKPNAALDWLHFHDRLSTKVFAGAEWELHPYLCQAPLGFHYLFAGPAGGAFQPDASDGAAHGHRDNDDGEPGPFTGPRADFLAHEAHKANRASLQALQGALSLPLTRMFRSPDVLATDLLPYLNRMLQPDVKPVVVGGGGEQRSVASVRRQSEKDMVRRAAEAMAAVGVGFERAKIEDARGGYGGWVYRMEPPLDALGTFETTAKGTGATAASRYAVRQVLDQELHKLRTLQAATARQARFAVGGPASQNDGEDKENAILNDTKESKNAAGKAADRAAGVKRDFFGRVIANGESRSDGASRKGSGATALKAGNKGRIWVTYHEGYSNAVRKPISLRDLMSGF